MVDSSLHCDDQEGAEAEIEYFRQNLGPFVVAAQTTRMPMIFTNANNADNCIVFANDSFLALTGYDRSDLIGRRFISLVEEGDNAPTAPEVNQEFNGDHKGDLEVNYRRKDTSTFWASTFVSPVCDKSGAVVQHFLSFVDLTKHREEQSQLRMLIDELNHRVKNTLATVQSIVSQALRAPLDTEDLRDAIESRIFALSRSHDLLTQVHWEGTGLHDLLDTALEPFGAALNWSERFTIVGDNIHLSPKMTLALGIAFHELATNAMKYGAFSNEVGTIQISWALEPRPVEVRLILVWQERDGPRVEPRSIKGFGSQVIERGLAHELQAKVDLEFAPGGVVCTIDMPAPSGADHG